MHYPQLIGSLIAAALVGSGSLSADVKLPSIFGDHMVLQQDTALPVWGTADSGEKVTVTLGNETGSAVAGADGKWMVKLAPLPEGSTPLTMTVTGKNSLKFDDVLVGDVWVCSGQSNMEFALGAAHDEKTELPQATDPQLRIFLVTKKTSLDPLTDVAGKWELCAPNTVNRFSAVGYFFGHDLRKSLNRPIGLIGTYWGGTPAQAWTSISGLQKEPSLKHFVDAADKARADFPKANADFPAKMEAYKAEKAKWDQEVGTTYNATLKDWNDAVAQARATGAALPSRPVPSVPAPKVPTTPDGGPFLTANLYNGMLAPLIPYAIKGAIWYQGEANAGAGLEYRVLFSRMISDWREKWGQGDFPFLFVQLAAYKPGGPNWNILRESQTKTLALPHTGMASALDIGDPNNIHPIDKHDVGHRLAVIAQTVAYGRKGVISGPLYDKFEVKGDKVQISFTQTDSGLMIGSAPWTAPGVTPLPNTTLVGFLIAGDNKKWVPADAKIEGNTVIVSSADVSKPVAVRYAWEAAPSANLYNKEGMPASPFRTDDWVDAPPTPPTTPAAPSTNAAPVTK